MLWDDLTSITFKGFLSLALKTLSNLCSNLFISFFLYEADMLSMQSPRTLPDKKQPFPLFLGPELLLLIISLRSWGCWHIWGPWKHLFYSSAFHLKQKGFYNWCFPSKNDGTKRQVVLMTLEVWEAFFLYVDHLSFNLVLPSFSFVSCK